MPELRRGGGRLHYVEQNSEGIHKLVLLHPQLASSAIWEALLPGFDDSFRVIAFDLRGFGQSEKRSRNFSVHALADEVRIGLNAIGVKRCSVMAVGAGGAVALSLAARYPSLVFKLILVNTTPLALDPVGMQRQVETLAELAWEPAQLTQFLRDQLYPDADDEQLAELATVALQADCSCAVALAKSQQTTDLVSLLPQVTAQTLVLFGEGAGPASRLGANLISGSIPRAKSESLPGCGSLPLLEDPAGVQAAALKLLNAWDLVRG